MKLNPIYTKDLTVSSYPANDQKSKRMHLYLQSHLDLYHLYVEDLHILHDEQYILYNTLKPTITFLE